MTSRCYYCFSLEDTDDTALAIKCYNEILALDPGNAPAKEGLASLSGSRASSADQQPVVSSTK